VLLSSDRLCVAGSWFSAACYLANLTIKAAATPVACRSGAAARNPVSASAASGGWFLAAQAFCQACGHSRHGQQVNQFPGGPRQ
jgi:hypothetical protein